MRARTMFASAVATAAMALTPTVAAAAPSTFDTGFVDQAAMQSDSRDLWLGRAQSVGATRVRLAFFWRSVAPTRPPADQAGSAAWPGYQFGLLDAQVRAAVARGVTPLLGVTDAPAWATQGAVPKSERAAAWKPDPVAFGLFMRAVAERYSGAFPDPLQPGKTLPKVDQFQAWNEPNLGIYLAPQYENRRPFASIRYRELLNAAYAGVKSVQPAATVVGAGLAPYGDPGTNPRRTRPLLFLRQMLCLDDARRKVCDDRTQADVLAMHPYTRNKPSQGAADGDDVAVMNLNRVQDLIDAATSAGTLGPRRPPLWVTEIHWETKPDPEGLDTDVRAKYISEAMWRFWRVGVPVAYWYLLQDEVRKPGEAFFASYQTGIFNRAGRRKGDARAFRFPLLVTGSGIIFSNVWFRTPTKGTTTIQVLRKGRWTSVKKVRGLPVNGVARVKIRKAGVRAIRAKAGKATSYAWDMR